jgi:1,4-alpha-glucan branching enzyme
MPGDPWQKFANLRLLYGLMFGFPGKKLLFMGGDFGQWDEWFHEKSIDWHLLQYAPHQGVQKWVRDLHAAYRSHPALHQIDFHYSGFQWIDFHDSASSVISFERLSNNPAETVVMVCNFTPIVRKGYRVGVPGPGVYRELLNSDSALYGGGNVGNGGAINSEPVPQHGRAHSVSLTLPPLGILFLKPGT